MHLHVGDLEQAAAFYHAGLGLDKVVWSYAGVLFLSAGGYHHHLGLNVWSAGAPAAGDNDAQLLEWTLELPQLCERPTYRSEALASSPSRSPSMCTSIWGNGIPMSAASRASLTRGRAA